MPPPSNNRRKPAPLPSSMLKKMSEARSAMAKLDFQRVANLYKEVLAAHPDNTEALGSLGFVYGITGRAVSKGLSLMERALTLDPGSSDIRCKIARVRMLKVEPDVALEHLLEVIEAEPRRLEALSMAAQCCEHLNQLHKARDFAQRAVAVRRNDPEANLILAQIDSREKRFDEAKTRLKKLVSKSTLPADIHHRALTELGFVLDKIGEYETAYDAFRKAGEEIAKTPLAARVDSELVYKRLDAYRGRVTRDLVGRFSGEQFDTPAPTFLVGFPRSGTTMTEQVMAAHPAVVTSDEHPLIDQLGRALMEGASDPLDVPSQLETLDADRVRALRAIYWEQAKSKLGHSLADLDGKVFVDKLPPNIVDLAMINTVFPDAKIIVALRDPRDVCLSGFMQWFVPNPAMVQLLQLDSAARFYAAVMGLYLDMKPNLTLPLLEIRYEDTVSDLEPQARRIIEHLDLEWHDDLLNFHEKAKQRAIRTPSYAAVTEKVHTRAIARWKNYSSQFAPFQAILSPAIEAFGYDPAD